MERKNENNVVGITPGVVSGTVPFDEITTTKGGVEDGTTTIVDPETGKTTVIRHGEKK